MKASEIVQLKRDLNDAIDAAGKGEYRWFIFLEKMDELGYDLFRRPPQPIEIVRAVEACAQIGDAVAGQALMDVSPADLLGTPTRIGH